MKSIESTDPRPSENDILEFENRWNLQLPQDYRSFLLKHNGGRPFPAMFPISGMENNPEGQVQDFFGLGTAIKSYDLNWVLENLGVPQPDGLLPVGCTASGDYLCISTKSGRVLFWDRMACWGKPMWSAEDFYSIADSFNEFLDGLRERIPPNETEIDRIIRTNDAEALRTLLKNGYQLETENINGLTAIERAAIRARPELIQILFEHGAHLRTSLEIAKQNLEFFPKHKSTVELLEHLHSANKQS